MNNKIKASIGAMSIGSIVLALLIVIPSPMANINLVISAPTFDNDTRITWIALDNSDNLMITSFAENNQSDDIEVGQYVTRFSVSVKVSKDYAATEADSHANTRAYLTLKNPGGSTVWENWLENTTIETEYADYWSVLMRGWPSAPIQLTEGTWTIIVKYDVYA